MSMFSPTPHPLLPLPSEAVLVRLLSEPSTAAETLEMLRLREERIAQAVNDPYRYGFDLPHWADADALLREVGFILFVFGGNRAAKSEWAAKRVVETVVRFPGTTMMCLHETEATSIQTQQRLIWKYLPLEMKALNEKRHAVHKIRFSMAGGFTEMKLIFPNRSEIHFVTYKQDPGGFEGWELGVPSEPGIGAWADENIPLPWVKMLKFRLSSRAAKLVLTFTPVNGMTPTIKELVGNAARVLRTRFAELLPDRVNLPGLPVGHMPYVTEPNGIAESKCIYFFSEFNPFGSAYTQIKKLCQGMASTFVEIRAYGYARDAASRAFPLFSAVNVIEPSALPAVGTNYMLTDPAGRRNFATVWVRVAPGNPPTLYFYRDWPDVRTHGEWAQTASNPNKEDGEAGPAQDTLGMGYVEYKKLWLKLEALAGGGVGETDPYRARLREKMALAHGDEAVRAPGQGTRPTMREEIAQRIIDPRAGRNQHIAEHGGTCLVDQFAERNVNAVTGEVEAEAMVFDLASGVDIEEGVTAINTLLFWNPEAPLVMGQNAPRLFVSKDCKQVIWAMQNWTGNDGEKGACKDFVDLVRYAAMSDLIYLGGNALRSRGGGSY